MKLAANFYLNSSVVKLAPQFLGKVLSTKINGILTAAVITEVEAYAGKNDRACHAYNGKITKRNQVMYGPGGHAYVYLCYGMHHLFNIVTNVEGCADAVLVRAGLPVEGVDFMHGRLKRKNSSARDKKLFLSGPGILAKALGLTTEHTRLSLLSDEVWIEDRGLVLPKRAIQSGPRIGIDYAGADALLPWRFWVDEKIVSLKNPPFEKRTDPI